MVNFYGKEFSSRLLIGTALYPSPAAMDLGEAAVGREDQNPLGRLAEWKRLLAVGRRHLGDHEIPSADDLVLEALRGLCGGRAGQ